MIKRIFLFLVVNILVVGTISIVLNFLHLGPYFTAHGINIPSLLGFCLIWGMGGALISLLLSKHLVKWTMGVKVGDPRVMRLQPMLEKLAKEAKLPVVPELGLFQMDAINAFATGASKRKSLVAVSTGLLTSMNDDEIEGVLAHELAHIANGDMVTMTLLQGVVNAFVMFLARIIAFALAGRDRERVSYLTIYILEIAFMILGSFVICGFSRWREFRADKMGAQVASKEKMCGALERLLQEKRPERKQTHYKNAEVMMFSGGKMLRLFATHPPLEERIKRLRKT